MKALSTTISHLVSLLGQSFQLSAIFPSLVFIALNVIFVPPLLPEQGMIAELSNLELSSKALLALAVAVLSGYALSILNIPIIRFYEGYPFKATLFGRLLTWWHRGRLKWLDRKVEELGEAIVAWEDQIDYQRRDPFSMESFPVSSERLEEELELLRQKLAFYENERTLHFPPTPAEVIPTKLGNTIAAFERYPSRKYGIDAVVMWPRLTPVLAREKYAVFVNREKAGLDFLLNLSILAGLFGLEMILVWFLFKQGFPVFELGLAVSISAFCYWASITSALHWGGAVSVAFDMYRHKLRKALGVTAPASLAAEKEIWRQLSAFYRIRDMYEYFDYSNMDTEGSAETQAAVERTEAESERDQDSLR
jgi:hypothetical protein